MFSKIKNVTIVALLSASFAYADGGDWVDAKMGVGTWVADAPSGKMGDGNGNNIDLTTDFGIQEGEAQYMWAEFQHFLPLIPHARIEYAAMPFTGASTTPFSFGGYTVDANVSSTLNLDNLDAIVYYDMGLFDDFIDLNYGLGAKVIMGQLDATVAGQAQAIPVAGAAIYVYLNARAELPMGFGVEYEYKTYPGGLDFDGEIEFTASILKVDYTLELSIFKLGIEAGQRAMDLKLNVPNTVYSESSLSGIFYGAFLKIEI
jgi:outer membrane protein